MSTMVGSARTGPAGRDKAAVCTRKDDTPSCVAGAPLGGGAGAKEGAVWDMDFPLSPVRVGFFLSRTSVSPKRSQQADVLLVFQEQIRYRWNLGGWAAGGCAL